MKRFHGLVAPAVLWLCLNSFGVVASRPRNAKTVVLDRAARGRNVSAPFGARVNGTTLHRTGHVASSLGESIAHVSGGYVGNGGYDAGTAKDGDNTDLGDNGNRDNGGSANASSGKGEGTDDAANITNSEGSKGAKSKRRHHVVDDSPGTVGKDFLPWDKKVASAIQQYHEYEWQCEWPKQWPWLNDDKFFDVVSSSSFECFDNDHSNGNDEAISFSEWMCSFRVADQDKNHIVDDGEWSDMLSLNDFKISQGGHQADATGRLFSRFQGLKGKQNGIGNVETVIDGKQVLTLIGMSRAFDATDGNGDYKVTRKEMFRAWGVHGAAHSRWDPASTKGGHSRRRPAFAQRHGGDDSGSDSGKNDRPGRKSRHR